MRIAALLPLVLLLIATDSVLAQRPAAKVDAAAIRVVRKTYGKGFDGLNPLNASKPGTTVVLIIQQPGGGIITVDDDKSKLTTFTDDKGNKLMSAKSGGFGRSEGIGSFPKIAKDTKAAMIELKGKNLPGKGAQSVRAKGTIRLAVATKKTKATSKAFAVKPGGTVKVGSYTFKVKKASKPKYGNSPLQIELEAKQDLSGISAFRFLDAKGKPINSESAGKSRFGFNNNITEGVSFRLGKKVDQCVVELDVWADRKEIDVPFDLNVSIGQ